MEKLQIHRMLSILLTAVGVAFMLYMIFEEDEPGAVPLVMIVSGAIWYFITRRQMRTKADDSTAV